MSGLTFTVGKTDSIEIEGKEFSQKTLKAALAAHANFEDEPYIFKAGDVAKCSYGVRMFFKRRWDGEIRIIDNEGNEMTPAKNEQEYVERMDYVKIGELSDFLPKDE